MVRIISQEQFADGHVGEKLLKLNAEVPGNELNHSRKVIHTSKIANSVTGMIKNHYRKKMGH